MTADKPAKPTRTRDVQIQPGETCADFIARCVATAGPLTPEQRSRIRHLLPPVPASAQYQTDPKKAAA